MLRSSAWSPSWSIAVSPPADRSRRRSPWGPRRLSLTSYCTTCLFYQAFGDTFPLLVGDLTLNPDSDRDEAIVSVPEDRVFRNFRGEPLPGRDYSSVEKECAAGMLP